jgi:hypothetical protein
MERTPFWRMLPSVIDPTELSAVIAAHLSGEDL